MLAKLSGPPESWPPRSRLLRRDGTLTPVRLPGYVLQAQFRTPDGFLFITDYDCPFEELTCFTLVSPGFHVLARRALGGSGTPRHPYPSTFVFSHAQPLDERTLIVTLFGDDPWRLRLRPWGIPFFRPRIDLVQLEPAGATALPRSP